MGITRKSKRRTVSHADTSLISLPNDSSSIRHRFLLRKNLENQLHRQRVQKCMIATVTEAHLTAFVSLVKKLFRSSVHCYVQFYLELLRINSLSHGDYSLALLYGKHFYEIFYAYLLRCNIKFDYKIYVRASISR